MKRICRKQWLISDDYRLISLLKIERIGDLRHIYTYPKKERKKILQKVENGRGGAVFLQPKLINYIYIYI